MTEQLLAKDQISREVNSKIINSSLSGVVKVFLLKLEPVITDQIQGLMQDSSSIVISDEDSIEVRKMREAIKQNPMVVADLYVAMGSHVYHSAHATLDQKFRKKTIEERIAGNGLLGIATQAFAEISNK